MQHIISSGMVGIEENYMAQIIIKTRQCVLCKNHVATSKSSSQFALTVYETYLCPAHNFVVGPASGMVQYRDLVFHPFVGSHQGISYSRH